MAYDAFSTGGNPEAYSTVSRSFIKSVPSAHPSSLTHPVDGFYQFTVGDDHLEDGDDD